MTELPSSTLTGLFLAHNLADLIACVQQKHVCSRIYSNHRTNEAAFMSNAEIVITPIQLSRTCL